MILARHLQGTKSRSGTLHGDRAGIDQIACHFAAGRCIQRTRHGQGAGRTGKAEPPGQRQLAPALHQYLPPVLPVLRSAGQRAAIE